MKKFLLFLLPAVLSGIPLIAADCPTRPPHHRQHMKKTPFRFEEKFFANFPEEERLRLKELEAKDPKEFRKAIREHFRKKREQERKKFEDLRKKYLNETDPEKKAAAKEEIRTNIARKIEWHIRIARGQVERNEKHLKALQERQKKLNAHLEKLNKEKDAILEKTLTEVLDPAYTPPVRNKPDQTR